MRFLDSNRSSIARTTYSFQGQERDDEVKGAGNSYTTEFRKYDPRVGRWLSLDPLMAKYPSMSPFCAFSNNSILFKDSDGREIIIYYDSGEKDAEGQMIRAEYKYGSGLKLPKDKFVRQTVRTLNKIQRSGRDPLGIIATMTSVSEVVAIRKGATWDKSAANFQFSQLEKFDPETGLRTKVGDALPDIITWNPHSGYISSDGVQSQSSANALLHEISHTYYNLIDPECHFYEEEQIFGIIDSETQSKAFEAFDKQQNDAVGNYHTYSDKWIIKFVEPNFREGVRQNHSDGYFVKTKGGTFSTRGTEYAKGSKRGKIKDLKKRPNRN